jgi:hypothetical protein
MKKNLVALSIFSFAVCFVIGCWLIANGLSAKQNPPIKQTAPQHQLLTKAELVQYLGLSEQEINKLTKLPDGNLGYTSELPHIEIGETVYYPKLAVDKWLLNVELTIIP